MVCKKLKFKITVYFVTSVQRLILNIVSTILKHKNINKKKDRDAFDLLNITKSVDQSFLYFDILYSLMLAYNIDIYLSFVIIYCNRLKYITVISQRLQ